MLRRLYDATLALAERPQAPWALGAVSFAESSFFPIPPDAMLVPMCLAQPERAWLHATIATITSVLGGLFGYFIGAVLYDSIGIRVIEFYGLTEQAGAFRDLFSEHGHWTILIAGFTPIPYKLITITSGFAAYDVGLFVLLSALTRGARFFLLAGLLYYFGAPIRRLIDRYFNLIMAAVIVVGILGFVVVSFVL
jgi:membrane protein YqaA with SNARE-associated domain